MRYSVIEDDPGYANWRMTRANGKDVVVLLNGAECGHIRTVDEELGFVERLVLDDKGLPQIDPNAPDRCWTETVKGDVKVEIRPAG